MKCINCGTDYNGPSCPTCGLSEQYCLVLYRWEERRGQEKQGTQERQRNPSGSKPKSKKRNRQNEKSKNTAKLVIGIISVAVFIVIVFQSCAAGFVGAFTDGTDSSGFGGMVVAFMMLIGGIVGIAARKSIGGGAAAAAIYAFGSMIGFSSQGIFGDLVVWSFLAMAFGIAYLVMSVTSLSWRVSLRKWWLYPAVVFIVLSIIYMFAGGGGGNGDSQSGDGAIPPNQNQVVSKDTITTSKMTVKYISHNIIKDNSENDVLRIVLEYTNLQEEASSYALAASDKAYQDGIQLESAYIYNDDEVEDSFTEIKKGASIQVATYYKLRNLDTDVEFEVSEFLSFNDSKLEMVLPLS